MLDIKFVRENPEIVKQNIRNKFQDKKLHLVDEVIELDLSALEPLAACPHQPDNVKPLRLVEIGRVL